MSLDAIQIINKGKSMQFDIIILYYILLKNALPLYQV